MRMLFTGWCLVLLMASLGCSHSLPFAEYQREFFTDTSITKSAEQTITLTNPYTDQPQHIRAIGFDGGGNAGGHFTIKGTRVAGRELQMHDLTVPPGGALTIHVVYAPRDLKTTRASFGGIESGQPEQFKPYKPEPKSGDDTTSAATVASQLIGGQGDIASPGAQHRALVVVTYDYPKEGVLQLELVGEAVPGPNGEITATGVSGGVVAGGDCTPAGRTACFEGQFSISLPGIVDEETTVDLTGPFPITIDGSSASIDMAQFPLALFVIGGDALAALPIDALSVAINGDESSLGQGTFDGQNMGMTGLGFRIRIYFSAMTPDAVETGTAPVDFRLTNLELTTLEPLAGDQISFGMTTTLGQNPSGNALADPFLTGAEITVRIHGTLTLP